MREARCLECMPRKCNLLEPMTEETKRIAPLSVRLSEEERAELDRRAAEAGLTRNAYVKLAILGRRPSGNARAADRKLIAQFLAAAANIQDRLHEIEIAGGDHGSGLLLEQARDQLIDIRAALFELAGRRP
jgi:hypothetical protein